MEQLELDRAGLPKIISTPVATARATKAVRAAAVVREQRSRAALVRAVLSGALVQRVLGRVQRD
jgi:hypothetical protein